MTKKIRALLVAVVALVAFSAFAGTASALDAAPAGDITMASLGKLTFDGIIDIDCNVTLRGDLLATASNTANTAVGTIESDTIASCTGAGSADALVEEEEPWTIRLLSAWAGPSNNVSLYFDNAAFTINNIPFIGNCLYQGDPAGTITTDANGRTGLVTSSQTSVPKFSGPGGCPSTGRMLGTFSVTQQDLDL